MALQSIVPPNGVPGDVVVLNGTGFGTVQGKVIFNGNASAVISGWADTQIVVQIPQGAGTGLITIIGGDGSMLGSTEFFETLDNA